MNPLPIILPLCRGGGFPRMPAVDMPDWARVVFAVAVLIGFSPILLIGFGLMAGVVSDFVCDWTERREIADENEEGRRIDIERRWIEEHREELGHNEHHRLFMENLIALGKLTDRRVARWRARPFH